LLPALIAAAGVSGYALAQNQPPSGAATVVLAQQGSANVSTAMGPVNSAAAQQHDIRVNTLANDTFVVVKDVSDSQIVFIYRVDPLGKVSLADKKRFYY
jgi:hypothetical protein